MSMPKAVRRMFQVLAVLLGILVVLVVLLACFMGPTIKTAAENIGPKVLGVPVTVERVSVNLFSGKVALHNLRVGNPAGYSSDPVFSLGELQVNVNLASLPGTNAIVVNQIIIRDMKVAYEVVKGVANIEAIQSKIQPPSNAKAPPEAKTPEKNAAAPSQKPARKVIIDRFECTGGQVSYRADITLGKAVPLPLPPIIATNIGRQSNGVTIASAVGTMILEILKSVGTAITDMLQNIGKESLSKGVNAVKDGMQGVGDALKHVKLPF